MKQSLTKSLYLLVTSEVLSTPDKKSIFSLSCTRSTPPPSSGQTYSTMTQRHNKKLGKHFSGKRQIYVHRRLYKILHDDSHTPDSVSLVTIEKLTTPGPVITERATTPATVRACFAVLFNKIAQ